MATKAQKQAARKELARRELARREAERQQSERTDFGAPVIENNQFQVGGDSFAISDLFPGVVSVAERTANLVTSALAEPVSGLIAVADQVRFNPNQDGQPLLRQTTPLERADTVNQTREALTFQPRSEQAQIDQQAFAEMMSPVAEFIDSVRMGDEALEAGLPPAVATAYEAAPEIVGSMLTLAGLPSIRGPKQPLRIKPKDAERASMIIQGKEPAARIKLEGGSIVKNKLGSDAVSRGWDELAVSKVSSLKASEKPIYRAMVDKAKKYFSEFSPSERPSDVVGREITKRITYLDKIKQANGQKISKIINGPFGRQKIDIDDFVGEFLQDVSDLGGSIDKNGKLVFGPNSRLARMPGNQSALAGLFDKLKLAGNPTAKQVHEMKGWIDEFIDYGKSATKQESGVSKNVERLLKGYRNDLNNKLRTNQNYARANDVFSDAAGALTDMQKAIGPSMDIMADMAPKIIGQKMRTFLSNNANRVRTEVAVGELQAIANKWGGKFPDHDIAAQMKFINEMERLWGPFTDTAFKSEIGQAAQRVAESPNLGQVGREAVRMTSRQVEKVRKSRANQIKAIENLLGK